MNSLRTLVLVFLLGPACTVRAQVGASTRPAAGEHAFIHPGLLQNRARLDFMRASVLAGRQPWKDAWERLIRLPTSSLDFQPRPFAHVIRGAYNNPAIGSNEISASAAAAYSQAIQWYITRDRAHARKAIQILAAWSNTLQDFHQNDAKLLAAWTGHDFLNAAEILRCTDSGWQPRDRAQFRKMMMGVYYPLLKDFFPEANGNWDAAIMDTMLCMGVYFDDHAIFHRAVDHYLRGHLNGGITHYVYPSGQCQESTRDQGHAQLGLGEMALACQVAWTQGVDLYGAAGNRLALGFEYTARYNLGHTVPCEGFISAKSRGKLRDIYQVVLQHYQFDEGIAMPYTAQAARRTLGRSLSVLTCYRGPRDGAPVHLKSPPAPSPIAAKGGAQDQASITAPANAIDVSPGQSIQQAVDSQHGKSGWVVLDRGVHVLRSALRLPSNLTLCGQGAATILWLDPKATGPAIRAAGPALHDCTLRDLIIEGAIRTHPRADPNADRRQRTRPDAPRRAGIVLQSTSAGPMRHIRLEHVTVRNCTGTGVAIENAAGLIIRACSFTDNGNKHAANCGAPNDLSLTGVSDCQITGTRLNNSPDGDGISLRDCRDVHLVDDEIARSMAWGIEMSGSQGVSMQGDLIEGNESGRVRDDANRAPAGATRPAKVWPILPQDIPVHPTQPDPFDRRFAIRKPQPLPSGRILPDTRPTFTVATLIIDIRNQRLGARFVDPAGKLTPECYPGDRIGQTGWRVWRIEKSAPRAPGGSAFLIIVDHNGDGSSMTFRLDIDPPKPPAG